MLVTHCLLSSTSTTPFSRSLNHIHSHYSPHRPKFLHNPTISLPTRISIHPSWLAQADPSTSTTTTTTTSSTSQEEGPVELTQSIFATSDEPTPIQVATSVLLTGAISVFLFRAVRRRAKRVKEMRFRSSEVKKSLKDEALDSLKAIGAAPIEASKAPPSPIQTLLGGLAAGAIALVLYKFTTTIEAALNRQTVSDNFSVRQITITIRTIVNGLCYLATFVFGINSVGLLLYTVQLTFNSIMEEFSGKETDSQQSASLSPTADRKVDNSELSSSKEDQSSDNAQ